MKLPAKAEGMPGIPIQMIADCDGENCVWLSPNPQLVIIDGGFFKGDSKRAMLFGPKGVYRVWALTAKGSVISPKAECIVTIGDVPPGPDPGPGPGPEPPGPTPGPVPIPGDGLRVLVVYESSKPQTLTQRQIMYGQLLRSYLDQKCVKQGSTPEWRIYDKDASMTNESKTWQDAMKRPRTALPWIIISNGKQGFEGPLPDTLDQAMTLLQKYGGQ